MSRSLKLFVIFSVLLNLLLLGMLGGQISRNFLHPAIRPTAEEITAAMPPDKAAIFQQMLEATQHKIAPLREQIRATRRDALCILATDPFDKDAYLAQADALHELHGKLSRDIVAAAIAAAPRLAPQERIAFMDLLRPSPPPAPDRDCPASALQAPPIANHG